jgi:hypothetical protein
MGRKGLAWPVAALSCAVVVAGVVLWWIVQPSLGISVGIPAGATLVAAILAWVTAAPPRVGQSSVEQLDRARQTLADRVTEQVRGLGRPPRSAPALPVLPKLLTVHWVSSATNVIDDGARPGTDDVARMATRLRSGQVRRLIIAGSPGCGKTTLARLVMAELLQHPGPALQVPVFLPLTTWNPNRSSLHEWIVRQICEIAPELQYKPTYGATAVVGLICHGAILPILDGLDAVPRDVRGSVLTSEELLQYPRFIVTCRTEELREAAEGRRVPGGVVFSPGCVGAAEAKEFLRDASVQPGSWDRVFEETSSNPGGQLAHALSSPRVIYLARAAYTDRDSAELIAAPAYSSLGEVEDRILRALPLAQVPTDGSWAPSSPWYGDRAIQWLDYLAGTVCDRRTGELAWWSVFRAVPRMYQRRVAVRALVGSVLAIVLIAVFNMYHGRFVAYGWLTGVAYALAISTGCFFLSPCAPSRHAPGFQRPVFSWWVRQKLNRASGILMAGAVAALLFGGMIYARALILHRNHHPLLIGVVAGIVAGMVVALSAVIARMPSPPPSESLTGSVAPAAGSLPGGEVNSRSTWTSIGVAASLGLLFGLISGVLAVIEHHGSGEERIVKGLAYGIIMGLNFAAGTWLVSLVRSRTVSSSLLDPCTAYRAERRFALLAVIILSVTFASAFSLNSSLGWSPDSIMPNFVAGALAGTLVSEWPIYLLAVTIVASRGKLPLRLMRFLELCRAQGVLQPVGITYRFRERTPWMEPPRSSAGETGDAASAGQPNHPESVAQGEHMVSR